MILKKSCVICNKAFEKPKYCSIREWGERESCSVKCGNKRKSQKLKV